MKKTAEMEWPKFKRDRDRIRYNSQRYSNVSISEAFEDAYGMKLPQVSDYVNETPKELSIGDVVKARILSVSKNRVEFDTATLKTNLMSTVNLYKYDRFKKFLPLDPIDVRVTNIVKDRVYVDPLKIMLESFINPRVENPWMQKNLKEPKPIRVKNLQLSRGGFIGQAVIPNISDFVGEDYTIEAFIPGSQIVLNITDDFEQFVGKEVEAFVVNYIPKPFEDGKMSLICSAKEYIKFKGERMMIQAFNDWTETNEAWEKIENTNFEGKVTGVINSSKKCGVFIEIPELNVTGMVSTSPEELVNYKPRDIVTVKLTGFEEEMYFNQDAQQKQHVDPYIIKDGALEKCNLKPILKFV